MRARYPDRTGFAESRGVKIYWEQHGDGDHTVVFLPTWQIYDSRVWKMQVPYFARHFRVITYDAPGNGRSGRPATGFDFDHVAADALSVMDATDTARASVVTLSRGTLPGIVLAAEHPERVAHLVLIGSPGFSPPRGAEVFEPRERYEGWGKFNVNYWRQDLRGFAEFFASQVVSEPHSTKAREDLTAWTLGTTSEILRATVEEWRSRTSLREHAGKIHVPTLIVHGVEDPVRSVECSKEVHTVIAGSTFVPLEGAGHAPNVRDPVRTNLLIREFVEPARAGQRAWQRAMRRPRRALFISSPIGLGHALRDVAIARELRALHPDLEIDWLAQDPVTRVLEARGERVHPASRHLANESAHIESEAGEHDLHVFQTWRTMDEILLANFMVLHDVRRYLGIGLFWFMHPHACRSRRAR